MGQVINRILFSLLRSAICGDRLNSEEIAEVSDEVLEEVIAVAKKHDILHLISFALRENKIVSKYSKNLENEIFKAAYRYRQSKIELENICETFENGNIPFITLKGSVLRDFYPEAWMRTSCDIDILIKEEDIEPAILKLSEMGYKEGDKKFHDISLFSPSGVHLELHHSILENLPNIDIVLKKAWDFAFCRTGSRYEFKEEFFLYHVFAHMYYHFISGGCGIRSLIDIYIVKKRWGITYSAAEEFLKEAEIYTFAEKISALSDSLFSGETLDEKSGLLLSYIIKGGVYGTKKNDVTMKKAKSKNFLSYAFKRVFLPYRSMKQVYPVLKKIPVFLPFCYIHRAFSCMFGDKRKRVAYEFQTLKDVKQDEIDDINSLKKYLNLK